MKYTRTQISTAMPVDPDKLLTHARIDESMLPELLIYLDAAAREIEEYTGIALLTQTITCTTDEWPGQVIDLPVGPMAPDVTATIAAIELDGTTTAITSGFWLEGGRYPRLHWPDTQPASRLRLTYTAGYGSTHNALPADLAHAVLDQAVHLFNTAGSEAGASGLGLAAARIAARYRRVAL
ncbi:MAG: hypothetical protein INF93_08420 [Rhodobacter sp.]|jgi:uncharacterized phiE125 gp8 family phage protein|nr:hypothetical protein [Rhodobacter sp.]